MYKTLKLICIAAFLYAPTAFSSEEAQTKAEKHAPYLELVRQLGSNAIDVLTSKEISEEERKLRFEKIFNETFAVESIAQFVLGHYRRRATSEVKAEFLNLFKKTIADIYASRFRNYTNETFKITRSFPLGKKGVRVHSQILRAGAPPVAVEWKIYKSKNGELKVVDVIVERISMSTTQRSEFASIIQKNGGTVSGLNRALQAKLDK